MEPRPKDETQQLSGMVGLEELAKTDRILVQQVAGVAGQYRDLSTRLSD